jgi:hypothetical protein
LNWIQISVQIIKRFEKEKDFLTPIWQWGETQQEAEPSPASFSFTTPIFPSFALPSWAIPAGLRFGTGPAEPAWPLQRMASVMAEGDSNAHGLVKPAAGQPDSIVFMAWMESELIMAEEKINLRFSIRSQLNRQWVRLEIGLCSHARSSALLPYK